MTQSLRFPCDPVVDRDVDTLVRVVALLVGDIGDQLLVDTSPDKGQIDGVHGQIPFISAELRSGAADFNPWQGRR